MALPLETETILSVNITNKPGALGDIAKALATSGVNIEGFSVERGIVRFLTQDFKRAQAVVRDAGFVAKPIPVFVIQIRNRVGSLAELAQNLSSAGVDIINTFGVTHGDAATIYVRVDQIDIARKVLDYLPDSKIVA